MPAHQHSDDDRNLYRKEEEALARAEAILALESFADNPLRGELESLHGAYRRIYRQLKRLVRLSDAQQANLSELNETLEQRNRLIKETFGRFTSDELVEEVLASPHGLDLGGKRHRITILMSDLRGFTSLCDRISAEETLAMINLYLEQMTDVILQHGGTIVEFVGDAILAIFGAPVDMPDHARRAVACAVTMQQRMDGVNRRNLELGFPHVSMGIGINTGEVVVGLIGSSRRVKFGVAGSHVNLTSRIESFSVGGQILVSESTAEACGPVLRLDQRVEIKGKGLAEAVCAHEVGGIAAGYDLITPHRCEKPQPLIHPMEIEVLRLAGKELGGETVVTCLRALSPAAADLELVDSLPLELHANLRLRLLDRSGRGIPGDVYAKVTERGGDRCRVTFTSVPPEPAAVIQFAYGLCAQADPAL